MPFIPMLKAFILPLIKKKETAKALIGGAHFANNATPIGTPDVPNAIIGDSFKSFFVLFQKLKGGL